MLHTLIHDFLHLFFPHICAGCGSDGISPDAVLCIQCLSQLPVTNFHLHAGNQVEKIFWGRIPVTHASSFCYFAKGSLIQRLLHELKYKGNKEIGHFMGRMMGETLKQSNRFNEIDALIPLPLFMARQRRRGYNQATVLCEGISAAMNIPVMEEVVIRSIRTETQTHKNRLERWQNMEGRFHLVTPEAIKNKHVLLVDDVITTGATLEACGQALLSAQGLRLSIVSLAYTLK
ncbi:MAG: phosphoribosyltransferase family protein [Chitinophagaceae bacterium]